MTTRWYSVPSRRVGRKKREINRGKTKTLLYFYRRDNIAYFIYFFTFHFFFVLLMERDERT